MPTTPTNTDIAALAAPLSVEVEAGTGHAVAIQWTGNSTIYLVVNATKGPPQWYADAEIKSAHARM
jgi:hypothetical protein